jgi:RNA recognition motif. (a.k.a. RRM, RBD, or RNP domain)
MWNKENTSDITRRCIEKYGNELFIRGSQAAENIDEQIDELIAEVMGIDKEIVTIVRQWRTAFKKIAIAEGLNKVKELALQNKELGSDKAKEGKGEQVAKAEMITKTTRTTKIVKEKPQNKEEIEESTSSGTIEESSEDKKNAFTNMEDIRLIADSKEIMPPEDVTGKKFEQLEEYLVERYGSSSLDSSIWAPKADACKDIGSFIAKVAAVKIVGSNSEQREKSIRWSLRGNKHIKEIQDKFVNGNQWCIIYFDCKKGFEEAKERLEKKKDFEQFNLILEEAEIYNKKMNEKKDKELIVKGKREETARKELEEIQLERKMLTFPEKAEASGSRDKKEEPRQRSNEDEGYKSHDKGKRRMYEPEEELNRKEEKHTPKIQQETITVWDLPHNVSRTQVFDSIRHLGKIRNIEMIRDGRWKVRAEVIFEMMRRKVHGEEVWIVPFFNDFFVRITPGLSRREILDNRNQFTLKLYNIPKDTNEILLFRQLRHTGARAIHIFRNTNGNNRGCAVVSFQNKEDLERARRCHVTYYNSKLQWEDANESYNNNSISYRRKSVERQQSILDWRLDIPKRVEPSEDEIVFNNWEERNKYDKGFELAKNKKEKCWPIRKVSASSENYAEERYTSESSNSTLAYVVQLIQKMEEKMSRLEQVAPNRS